MKAVSFLAQKPKAVVGTTRSGRTVRKESTAYLAEMANPKKEKAKKEKERQLRQQQQQQQKEDETEDGAVSFHVDTGRFGTGERKPAGRRVGCNQATKV